MRARFLRSGSHAFADHELLELLLFYSLPRENTNDIAHSLIERFGSLRGVASASVDELKGVCGVGENTAILIQLVMSLAQRCVLEDIGMMRRFDSEKKAVEFARALFLGARDETMYLLALDNSLSMIDCVCVAFGSVNELRPILRNIIERSVIKRASAVILLHNHPDGSVTPSPKDIRFSQLLQRELDIIGIELVEHIIVSGNDHFSVMKSIRAQDDTNAKDAFYK